MKKNGHTQVANSPLGRVSVVIPVLNEAKLLPRCLDSFLTQTVRPLEMVVVDGRSTDGTREVLKDYTGRFEKLGVSFRVLTERKRGIVRARDLGFRKARGTYIFSADADTLYDQDVLALLQRTLRLGFAGVTGYSKYEGFVEYLQLALAAYDVSARVTFRLLGTVLSVRGYHTGFVRNYYLQGGGMDIRCQSAEDELGLSRLLRVYGKIAYEPRMVAQTSDRRGRGGALIYFQFLLKDYWGGYLLTKLGWQRQYPRPFIDD